MGGSEGQVQEFRFYSLDKGEIIELSILRGINYYTEI